VFGRGIVQFLFRRTPCLGKLRMIPAANAGDEFTGRHRRRTFRYRLLEFRDRKSPLDATCFITRIHRGARVVYMCIEETGHNSSPSQVDRLCTRAKRHRLSHIEDSAVLDRERRPDNSASVHEFSIHEDKIDILCSLYRRGRNLRYCTKRPVSGSQCQSCKPVFDPFTS
jgi:hypothetical protein